MADETVPAGSGFDDPAVQVAVESGIDAMIAARLAASAPRWVTVTALDHDAGTCTVDLGPDGTRTVVMHMIRPRSVGDVVLIEGTELDRRVVDVKGGFGLFVADGDTGDVKWTRASTAGPGWLYANGSTVVPASWTALIDLLGGNVAPDLRNRFPIGAGSTYAVGATGGATTQTLVANNVPAHSHPITDKEHRHPISSSSSVSADGSVRAEPGTSTNHYSDYAYTGITSTGNQTTTGTSFSILNPYVGLKPYIHR